MGTFTRQLRPAIAAVVVFTFVCGIAYPLAATALGRNVFPHRTDGSLIYQEGVVVGSELIGQSFADPGYFWPRPSAAGAGYDGSASAGSNLGPTNPELLDAIATRVADYRRFNNLAPETFVPVDAVTSSGSGLDPHISIANARLQAPRVAEQRGLDPAEVQSMIDAATDERILGVLGEPGVNVIRLNLALDRRHTQ